MWDWTISDALIEVGARGGDEGTEEGGGAASEDL